MAFYFLPNTFGNAAASMTTGTAASGYDKYDLIAGPRSTFVRTTAVAGPNNFLGYETTSDVTISHVIVARADKLLTKTGSHFYESERDSSGSWAGTAFFDLNPVTSGHLIGITNQDYVSAVTQTVKRGIRVIHEPLTTTHPMEISKLYASLAVDIGAPSLGQEFTPLPADTYATPPDGMIPYEVEGRFVLNFDCGAADVTAFEAIPQLLNWPLFLHDPSGDLWDWKLEHVIIENYVHIIEDGGNNRHSLSITFNRLKHYD